MSGRVALEFSSEGMLQSEAGFVRYCFVHVFVTQRGSGETGDRGGGAGRGLRGQGGGRGGWTPRPEPSRGAGSRRAGVRVTHVLGQHVGWTPAAARSRGAGGSPGSRRRGSECAASRGEAPPGAGGIALIRPPWFQIVPACGGEGHTAQKLGELSGARPRAARSSGGRASPRWRPAPPGCRR